MGLDRQTGIIAGVAGHRLFPVGSCGDKVAVLYFSLVVTRVRPWVILYRNGTEVLSTQVCLSILARGTTVQLSEWSLSLFSSSYSSCSSQRSFNN